MNLKSVVILLHLLYLSVLQNCVTRSFVQLMAWYLGITVIIQISCLNQQLRFVLLTLYNCQPSPPTPLEHIHISTRTGGVSLFSGDRVDATDGNNSLFLFFWPCVVHWHYCHRFAFSYSCKLIFSININNSVLLSGYLQVWLLFHRRSVLQW